MSEAAETALPQPDASSVTTSKPVEKALLALGLTVYCFGGYYLIGIFTDPTQAGSLHTRLDDWIPFSPAWMWIYEGVYTALLYPIFAIRCHRLFRRVALAYLITVTVCLVTWLVLPVTSLEIRPSEAELAQLDLSWFHNWGLRVNYALDPPLNLFPSLHVAISLLAGLCTLHARRAYGYLMLGFAFLVAIAICTVKQHFIVDGFAGIVLAVVTYLLVMRSYDPGEAKSEDVGYTWWGPATYLAIHLGVLGSLYLAHLAGWTPWEYSGTW